MSGFLLRRLAGSLVLLLLVLTTTFFLLRLIPGDPAVALAGEKASAAQIERMREALGLNRPLVIQYVDFVSNIATLQRGRSIRTGGQINQELAENLAPTIELW